MPRLSRLPHAILVTASALLSAPLALVMLLPWRDPQGPGAAWTAVGVYAGLGAAVVWAVAMIFGG